MRAVMGEMSHIGAFRDIGTVNEVVKKWTFCLNALTNEFRRERGKGRCRPTAG